MKIQENIICTAESHAFQLSLFLLNMMKHNSKTKINKKEKLFIVDKNQSFTAQINKLLIYTG